MIEVHTWRLLKWYGGKKDIINQGGSLKIYGTVNGIATIKNGRRRNG